METNNEASSVIPDHNASSAQVFLQLLLRHSGLADALSTGVTHPELYMILLALKYTDDYQIADYLLDNFEDECLATFYDHNSPKKPLRIWYHTFLNAVQDLWDSGLQPSSVRSRLGHFLPPKVPWHK